MKISKLIKFMLMTIVLGGSAAAMAANAPTPTGGKGELLVTGTVIPKSCVLDWIGGNEAQYGQISPTLNDTAWTPIGSRSLNVKIDCANKLPVALSFTDERRNSVPTLDDAHKSSSSVVFGLGKGLDTKNIGAYFNTFISTGMTVDNDPAEPTYSVDSKNWRTGQTVPIQNLINFSAGFHKVSASGDAPTAGNEMIGTFQIDTFLNTKSLFPTDSTVDLNGLTSITLNYLNP